MEQEANKIDAYLEIGRSRTFAVALDWPGWCRSGRDEAVALQTLLDYGPRYERALQSTDLAFQVPAQVSEFRVAERVIGNATTDFGAPDRILPGDAAPVDSAEVQRWQTILTACWRTFDSAIASASGKSLRTGPRGGGRNLLKIVQHVRDADVGYLASLGVKLKLNSDDKPDQAFTQIRQATQAAILAAARGELPARGPRGGLHWPPRYFVRRLTWHELDHAWEIEDRVKE